MRAQSYAFAFLVALTACQSNHTNSPKVRTLSIDQGIVSTLRSEAQLAKISTVQIGEVQLIGEARGDQGHTKEITTKLAESIRAKSEFQVVDKGGDAFLVARVSTVKERVGSDIGVTSPAEFGFTLLLLESATRSPVWEGTYHYRDQPLSENVLRGFKGEGFLWADLTTLIERSLDTVVSELAQQRRALFLKSPQSR